MADARDEWVTWFDRHGAALILLARSWVPNRADAEDVVQDAFVRFWRSSRPSLRIRLLTCLAASNGLLWTGSGRGAGGLVGRLA